MLPADCSTCNRGSVISDFQALIVALLALLPGASYTFAYERMVGAYGAAFGDRLVRFLAASAVFHAFLAGPEYLLYRKLVSSGDLGRGEVSAWWLELVAIGYVLLPTVLGWVVGYGQRERKRWARWLVGEAPEPRAWDYLWHANMTAVVRLKLKTGTWVAGVFGTTTAQRRSYASGYPEEGDLYLSAQVYVDSVTGQYLRDERGRPQLVEGPTGLLVRWSEVEFLDILEF